MGADIQMLLRCNTLNVKTKAGTVKAVRISKMSRSRSKQLPDVKPFRVRWTDAFGDHVEYYCTFQTAYNRYQKLQRSEDSFLVPADFVDAGSLALDVLDGVEWLRYK